ncbi:MAG: phosphatase PAP2 family protein [Lachnospiraceae bacterium]
MKKWMKEHTRWYCLLYFIFYLIGFELLEHIVTEPKYIIHCALDDIIPFVPFFVIPYFLWYAVLVGSFAYLIFQDSETFLNLCFICFGGMTFCLLIYAILPNGLNLRTELPNDGPLCKMMSMIYAIDTSTNVCPSIHVSSTTAIMVAVWKSPKLCHKIWVQIANFVVGTSICISTVFVRQHSVIDVVCGVLVTAVLYWIAYYTDWQTWLKNSRFACLTK